MSLFQPEKRALTLGLVVGAVAVLAIGYLLFGSTAREPRDFRGIQWGSPVANVPEMKLLAEAGDLKFYEKTNDRMKIGDGDVERIVYGFYKGRFYNVMIYYSSPANYQKIQEALSDAFGKPFQPNESEKKLFWNGEQVNLLLHFDEASNTGRVTYLYKPIQLEIEVSG
jgi:hypothetical protein